MAGKKTKTKLYDEARGLYCSTDMSIKEISEATGINLNTLYKRSTEENWVLLKQGKIEEAIRAKNIIISDRKLRNIKFYEEVLDMCWRMKDQAEYAKELKEIVTTHIMAEDRYFLLASESLEVVKEDEENKSESILDELAKM